jgi:hypothetical protein
MGLPPSTLIVVNYAIMLMPGHVEFSGKVILCPIVKTDLSTIRVLHIYVKHTDSQ